MKVKINYTSTKLFCVYDKEPIEIDEKYIEVTEDVLGDVITKTYRYDYLDMLIEEQLEINDDEATIEEDY